MVDAIASDIILLVIFLFFFNDTATTEIYTLSLHDALPIFRRSLRAGRHHARPHSPVPSRRDRKSTRLNSSHSPISYAVFCLKKKKKSNRVPRSRRGSTQRSGVRTTGERS